MLHFNEMMIMMMMIKFALY